MFPSFKNWCDTVLHPEDTHPWDFRTEEFYEEYRLKYSIAKLIKPKSILEVGVRFGYSAHSFMFAVPEASYIGLDKDEPSWGPYKGVPRRWAIDTLRTRFPDSNISSLSIDTQVLQRLHLPPADMVHVDGDHSYSGALHDMIQFWTICKRVMVVDDVVEIPQVEMAVEDFLRATPSALLCGSMTALRGAALIVRDE